MKSSCIIQNYLDPEVASEDLPSSASWNPYLKITLKVLKVSDQRPVIGICSAFFKHKQGWINADKGVKQPKATNPLILKMASRTSKVSAAKRNVRSPDVSMGTHNHWGDTVLCCYNHATEPGIILWKPMISTYIYICIYIE